MMKKLSIVLLVLACLACVVVAQGYDEMADRYGSRSSSSSSSRSYSRSSSRSYGGGRRQSYGGRRQSYGGRRQSSSYGRRQSYGGRRQSYGGRRQSSSSRSYGRRQYSNNRSYGRRQSSNNRRSYSGNRRQSSSRRQSNRRQQSSSRRQSRRQSQQNRRQSQRPSSRRQSQQQNRRQTQQQQPRRDVAARAVDQALGRRVAAGPTGNAIANKISQMYGSTTKAGGYCARAVRTAIEAATGKTLQRTQSAKNYGPSLEKAGFQKVTGPARIGDVAIFQSVPGHPHGHIQVLTERGWVSDFKQRDQYPGSAYRNRQAPMQLYRAE